MKFELTQPSLLAGQVLTGRVEVVVVVVRRVERVVVVEVRVGAVDCGVSVRV